jgi:hypothetical protein
MGGARVESKWELDSEITFTGEMANFNKVYRDRGTVLAIEREKLLKYSHFLLGALRSATCCSRNQAVI